MSLGDDYCRGMREAEMAIGKEYGECQSMAKVLS